MVNKLHVVLSNPHGKYTIKITLILYVGQARNTHIKWRKVAKVISNLLYMVVAGELSRLDFL